MTEKRLFVAVNIPDKIREEIANEIIPLLPRSGLKPVYKENLHFTLKFIGHVPEEKVKEFKGALEAINAEPFKVGLSGFSHFNARVLFIKAGDGAEKIVELGRAVNKALGTEDRCDAHLTIARNKDLGKKDFLRLLGSLEKKGFEAEFIVDSFELMESVLSPKGPSYHVVFSRPLSSPKT